MQALTMNRMATRRETDVQQRSLAGALALLVAVLVLLAMLPTFATAGGAVPDREPVPMPAPGPALVIVR